MSVGFSYSRITTLPSRGVPYPEGTNIRVRNIDLDEVMFFSEHHGRELDILDKFHDGEIIKCEGIDFWDITYDDWQFLLLTVVASSYIQVQYTVSQLCETCGDEPVTLDLKIPNVQPIQVKPGYTATVEPAKVDFKSLDEEVDGPAQFQADSGDELVVDFYRLKHHRDRLINPQLKKIDVLIAAPEDFRYSVADVQFVNYAIERMDHSPSNEVLALCPVCKKPKKISIRWEGVDFIPFRFDEEYLRDRISFGKRSTPKYVSPNADPVPPSTEPLRQPDSVHGTVEQGSSAQSEDPTVTQEVTNSPPVKEDFDVPTPQDYPQPGKKKVELKTQ